MSILVTCFSHSGHTAALAHALAQRLGADEEPILEIRKRNGALDLISGGIGALFGSASEIRPAQRDPADYDLVLLGTPVWSGRPTPAVNAWLDRYGKNVERIAFFCTEGRRAEASTFGRMDRRLGHSPAACLALTEDEIGSDGVSDKVTAFLADIGEA